MSNSISSKIPIELILRSIQKDNDYINLFRMRMLDVIDSLSFFKVVDLDSNGIDFLSSLLFFFINYKIHNNKISPGQEYVNIRKKFRNKSNLNVTMYVFAQSFYSLFLSKLYEKIDKFTLLSCNFLKSKSEEKKSFTFHIFHKVFKTIKEKLPTEEELFDKLEEIQFGFFFINQTYFNFVDNIYKVKYEIFGNENSNDELIGKEAFNFIGKLTILKLIFELILLIKKFIELWKEETNSLINSKTNIFDYDNSVKKMNFKLKNNHKNLSNKRVYSNNQETKNCLLCLDERKNTSTTICGHLFCWDCIIKYLQKTPSCPFCRKICLPQNVIMLQNYK